MTVACMPFVLSLVLQKGTTTVLFCTNLLTSKREIPYTHAKYIAANRIEKKLDFLKLLYKEVPSLIRFG
jgi:hypothetical protein